MLEHKSTIINIKIIGYKGGIGYFIYSCTVYVVVTFILSNLFSSCIEDYVNYWYLLIFETIFDNVNPSRLDATLKKCLITPFVKRKKLWIKGSGKNYNLYCHRRFFGGRNISTSIAFVAEV
jgi:hypothetical protein